MERYGRIVRGMLMGIVPAYWSFMFFMTHRPTIPKIVEGTPDYILHFAGYFVIGFLLGLLSAVRRQSSLRAATLWVSIVAIYAAFDELTQPYFGRTADIRDWGADVCGVLAGWAAARLLCRIVSWSKGKNFPPNDVSKLSDCQPPPA